MAITPNGMIAKENDAAEWVTETAWSDYSGMIKKHGNMIIGRRTYQVMLKNDEFNRSKLNEIETVILANDRSLAVHNKKFVKVASTPRKALEILEKRGFQAIMVCGGGGLNASFMKENLVDEMYLDIEPLVFGKGIRLFAESDFEARLELVETKELSKDEVQLHYRVKG